MLDFTWSIFKETGNIDTYLLFKEIQLEHQGPVEEADDDVLADWNYPIS
ncbi:MAG: YqzL family protein [Bacillus sp. (in: firmicutes)]